MRYLILLVAILATFALFYAGFKSKQAGGRSLLNEVRTERGDGSFIEGIVAKLIGYFWILVLLVAAVVALFGYALFFNFDEYTSDKKSGTPASTSSESKAQPTSSVASPADLTPVPAAPQSPTIQPQAPNSISDPVAVKDANAGAAEQTSTTGGATSITTPATTQTEVK